MTLHAPGIAEGAGVPLSNGTGCRAELTIVWLRTQPSRSGPKPPPVRLARMVFAGSKCGRKYSDVAYRSTPIMRNVIPIAGTERRNNAPMAIPNAMAQMAYPIGTSPCESNTADPSRLCCAELIGLYHQVVSSVIAATNTMAAPNVQAM